MATREFIVRMNDTTTSPNFSLNNLTGVGRLDLACRAVSSALFLSHSIRKNSKIYVNLNGPPSPPVTILFDAKNLKRVYPDERNIASHIRLALKKFDKKEIFTETEPGIFIAKKSFEELIKEKNKKADIYYLSKDGKDIRKFKFNLENDLCFILGDHKGIPKKTEKFLDELGIKKISVGEIEYLASQVITIVHYELDRRLASR